MVVALQIRFFITFKLINGLCFTLIEKYITNMLVSLGDVTFHVIRIIVCGWSVLYFFFIVHSMKRGQARFYRKVAASFIFTAVKRKKKIIISTNESHRWGEAFFFFTKWPNGPAFWNNSSKLLVLQRVVP